MFIFALGVIGCCLALVVLLRIFLQGKRRKNEFVLGFFHPYCNDGGGGERVLWCAIQAVQEKYEHIKTVVYTGDVDKSPREIVARAKLQFGLEFKQEIEFVFLKHRSIVEASRYPYFTLLCQSLGGFFLGLEAIFKLNPDVMIDTMGYAFTYPLFRLLAGCRVAAYVHFPIITTDMLKLVHERRPSYNNNEHISSSPVLSFVKLIYYHIFAFMYSIAGRFAETIMVNSTWTRNHIVQLWRKDSSTFIVYPPCDTSGLQDIPLSSPLRQPNLIVSVAQFRPEKDHRKQLKALSVLLIRRPELKKQVTLVVIGSCRNEEEGERVESLKSYSNALGLENNVRFCVNVTYSQLQRYLGSATIGLHSMWNEHFGIGVVEFMAAGVIPIGHNSGGPRSDIIVPFNNRPTGYLASTPLEYADRIEAILEMTEEERLLISSGARDSVASRFSEEVFRRNFADLIEPLVSL
eukprot:GCRY01001282.1.p1 GENE.GCRY01001282.1~~GCRY01001282.1.p1  ORF type:complete len:462 (-),score=103.13 GCRY01001282.1:1121-2506(-)